MKRRSLLAATAALAAIPGLRPARAAGTKIVWWHAMTAANGDNLNKLVAAFNASQSEIEVQPVYKGAYADTLTAAIAAYRAGQAPHLVQMFEVGTGTMLAAGKAVKQIWELSQESGVAIDPAQFIPAVRGYYSLPDGKLASMPFNSSTAMLWYNKDMFAKAGLNPDAPPATWDDAIAACRALKTKANVEIPMTTSWPCWIQMEQYSAIHDLPFATEADGFDGLGAELKINSPAHVKQLQRLMDMTQEGLFRYTGRGDTGENLFPAEKVALMFESSGDRGLYGRTCKFNWGEAMLPYDPQVKAQPNNSVIGGASLWVMTTPDRTPAEYTGVAKFLAFLALPENVKAWHEGTGYLPVTTAGYELAAKEGWYEKNQGADLPIKQLTRGHVTDNSRGFRLGRMPEIRNIVEEEMEGALGGKVTAQAALDNAVERGNKVLREFQKSIRS
ncbi:MAG TPA: sn-glycerol-3-phosphate ABC transporter substrate-binding protein UgpB [Acidisphaera sp.]|nr:sn-glycerol-3-phosphate ABC transporter substrate-binding protein UgpB [Acidisphaera sp.]